MNSEELKIEDLVKALKVVTIPRAVPIYLMQTILELIYKIEVTGLEYIPKEGGAIIICNHTDMLDIAVQGAYSPRKIIFLGKNEIFNPQEQIIKYINQPGSPFLQFPLNMTKSYIEDTLNAMGEIYSNQLQEWGSKPVVRNFHGNGAKAAVAYYEDLENFMISLVKAGEIISIYPEGTRTESGVMGAFKAMAAKLAIRAQVPIIPSGINGAWKMSEPKAFLSGAVFKTKIEYNVGNPITPDQFPKSAEKKAAKELTEELEKRVYFLATHRERRGQSRRFMTVL